METKKRYLQIHPQDNVAVALSDLDKGAVIELNGISFSLHEDIKAKHKFTLEELQVGARVIMYGVVVGKSTQVIRQGGLLHPFNVAHATAAFRGKQRDYTWQKPDITKWEQRTFNGYHRNDGQVGTQNYWLFIPLVFCENRNINVLKETFEKELGYHASDNYRSILKSLVQTYAATGSSRSMEVRLDVKPNRATKQNRFFKNIDGIKFITHDAGCGESNRDSEDLARVLAGYCLNPNVGGITILSLGCQKTQFDLIKKCIAEQQPAFDKPLLHFEQQQDAGSGEFTMMSEIIRQTFIKLVEVNEITRKPAPLSKLKVGVKCGGSDGFSGISANPAVGHTADILAALGAQVFMAEFPELCGVEQELQNRSVTPEIAAQFGKLMTDYAALAKLRGSGFDMNPSYGNIKDGLITDAMKSAGAAKKGGTSPVTDVLQYGEYGKKEGLNLVCTPGNDVLATSGMGAAGATIQLFTTGLGTPTGNPVSSVVKISTNKSLASKLPEIIDFDCGTIIEGEQSIQEAGEELLDYVIKVASGEISTKAMDLGQDDFMFWRRGISL